jgi:hypothetical protein
MRHFLSDLLLAVGVCATLVLSWPPRSVADEGPPSSREIDKLIAQLGSDSFTAREEATRLLQQRPDAIPVLRRALKSSDGEVARRAGAILEFFDRQEKNRPLRRLAALAKDGQVDLAVEKLVRHKEWDDEDAALQVLAELAGRLTDLEQKEFGVVSLQPSPQPGSEMPIRDFRRYREKMQPKLLTAPRISPRDRLEHVMVLRAEEIQADGHLFDSLVVCSGRVRGRMLARTVLFAGDSVEADVLNSVIVCDGDFTLRGDLLAGGLIIARGDVHCSSNVIGSRIIAGGRVYLKGGGQLSSKSKVKENEPNPLGFVTFFDPAKVGIKVEKADGGLRVKEAAKDKPFARAGLHADDLLTAVDGETVKDPEVFRRLLRAKLAVEGEMVLKVRRGEQTLEVRVPCKD